VSWSHAKASLPIERREGGREGERERDSEGYPPRPMLFLSKNQLPSVLISSQSRET